MMFQEALDFFAKYFEWVVGLLVTIFVGFGAAIYQIKRTKVHKALSFDLKSKTKLFTLHDEKVGTLEILFNGQPVRNAHIFIVVIFNSGDLPIATPDYEKPIEIVFSKTAEILSAAVIEKIPVDLNVEFEMAGNSVQLKPMLLNKGDAITFKFMLSDDSSDPSVSGRIVGVSRIIKTDFRSDGERRMMKLNILMSIFFFVSGVFVVLAPMGVWGLILTVTSVSLAMAITVQVIKLTLKKNDPPATS
jgi:hypothetical protein